MKKKLNEAYLPDKTSRAEKVVVALSGGVDSFVAAYLLKIQKFDLVAVTVSITWENGLRADKTLSCAMDEARMNSIKDFCHSLNIPHHVVKASEFPEVVVEKWLASRATGSLNTACWSCHEVRMRLIYQKMLQLNVKHFATGHYAKVFRHEAHDTAYVHTSNEEQYDQSGLLSRLPQEVLKHVMLPLSDLTKKEVTKLSENFGLNPHTKSLEIHQCFPNTEESTEFVKKKVPASFQKRGEIAMLGEDVSEHEGMLQWSYSQRMELRDRPSQEFFFSGMTFSTKKVQVAPKEFFEKKQVLLVESELSEETSVAEPFKGFIKGHECWIHPKELNTFHLEWDEPLFLWEGEIVVVNRKKGKNSKVLLSGVVRFLPEEVKVEERERDEKHVKLDYGRDF